MAEFNDDDGGSRPRSGGRSGGGARRGARGVMSGMSTAAVLDIVERLGLVDMVVDRLKARLEEVDIDELIDEIGEYLKRNPEVLVVSLGAVTVATGALVYLNRRSEGPRRQSTSGGAASTAGARGARSRRS